MRLNPFVTLPKSRYFLPLVTGFAIALSLLVYRLMPDQDFPAFLAGSVDFAGWINAGEDWLKANVRGFTRGVSGLVGFFLEQIEFFLWFAPWPAVVLAFSLPALRYGGLRLALFTLVGVMFWGMMGMWDPAMSTLALMGVSVVLCVVTGVALGVACAQSDRLEAVVRPILDTMQTMPSFVYLIPAIFFFGIGAPSAALAIVIYALPPVVRLTNLGIRQVAPPILEAADSFGSTRWQRLWKAEIPQAMPSIMLGINQTIMMVLGLAVLATIIGAGGLGEEVWKALRRMQVGYSLEGGLCIVFMAIIFDRMSMAAGRQDDSTTGSDPSAAGFRLLPQSLEGAAVARWIEQAIDTIWSGVAYISAAYTRGLSKIVVLAAGFLGHDVVDVARKWLAKREFLVSGLSLLLVVLLLDSYFFEIGPYPRDWQFTFREPVDAAVDWLAVNPVFIGMTTGIRTFIYLYLLNPLDKFLLGLPWWYVLAAFFVLFASSVSFGFAVVAILSFFFTGVANLWDVTLYTLASTVVSVAVCVFFGLPIGIAAAYNRTFDNILRPILDTMQTMPAFVYLIPVLMFFGGNAVTAIIATVVYAIPPMIRMTTLGIRQLPEQVDEVSNAFGTTELQKLVKIKLPMASPSIMLGVNQAFVMALAMQVITPLVAGLGLGREVFHAMNKANTGMGLVAGIGIVLLAIILDRLTQAWTRNQRKALGL